MCEGKQSGLTCQLQLRITTYWEEEEEEELSGRRTRRRDHCSYVQIQSLATMRAAI